MLRSWCQHHARAALILAVTLIFFAGYSWAQDGGGGGGTTAHPVTSDPMTQALIEAIRIGGVPAALVLATQMLKGVMANGFPLRVHLDSKDRALLRKITVHQLRALAALTRAVGERSASNSEEHARMLDDLANLSPQDLTVDDDL